MEVMYVRIDWTQRVKLRCRNTVKLRDAKWAKEAKEAKWQSKETAACTFEKA